LLLESTTVVLLVRKTLAKREITVDDKILILLVVLLRLNVKNLTFKGRIGMGDKNILSLKFLNFTVFWDSDKAGGWYWELHFFNLCVDLLGNFLVGLARLAWFSVVVVIILWLCVVLLFALRRLAPDRLTIVAGASSPKVLSFAFNVLLELKLELLEGHIPGSLYRF